MPTQPEIQPVVRTANVSNQRIITVEHPCVINDVDKGVKTLGGEHQIKRVRIVIFIDLYPFFHLFSSHLFSESISPIFVSHFDNIDI